MSQTLDDLTATGVSKYGEIIENLTRLYLDDSRPWIALSNLESGYR